ncbi:hypothetical protein NQD34_013677 [Periophthalmus magnuspinnatus]|nr:hypothetical protein NQD34_013677 [Periophthalmus magnuspinnatus]
MFQLCFLHSCYPPACSHFGFLPPFQTPAFARSCSCLYAPVLSSHSALPVLVSGVPPASYPGSRSLDYAGPVCPGLVPAPVFTPAPASRSRPALRPSCLPPASWVLVCVI